MNFFACDTKIKLYETTSKKYLKNLQDAKFYQARIVIKLVE